MSTWPIQGTIKTVCDDLSVSIPLQ